MIDNHPPRLYDIGQLTEKKQHSGIIIKIPILVFKPKPEEKPKITIENAQAVTKISNVEAIAKHILETHKVPTPIYTTPSRGIIFQVKKIYVGRKRKERAPKKNSKGKTYQQFRESQKSNDRDMITK